jgi:ADP-ribose pyrophosphatase YjhB (NUDIX family)
MNSERLAPLQWQPEVIQIDEQFKEESLALLAGQLAMHTAEGYPDLEGRLTSNDPHPLIDTNVNATWKVGQQIPALEERDAIAWLGPPTDDHYRRPVHPWLMDMLPRQDIGVVVGKGPFWRWGPNYTADAVVRQAGHVLLVERADVGMLALPGGFVDYDENGVPEPDVVTAARELGEEAHLEVNAAHGREIFKGPVADIRMTANAWPETTAFLFDLGDNPDLPPLDTSEETNQALWVPENEALTASLYGSHQLILRLALRA